MDPQDATRAQSLHKRDAADSLRRRALGKQRKQELLDSYLKLKEEVAESEGSLMRLDFQHKVCTAFKHGVSAAAAVGLQRCAWSLLQAGRTPMHQ